MKKIQKINFKAFAMVVGFFSCITIIGCKEKQTISADLIPPVDNINTFEINDFDLNISVQKHDSLLTNDDNYMLMALGKINNDPYFGTTNAGIYMQFQMPNLNFTFPEGNYDSVILSVPYYINTNKNYVVYGDTSASMIPLKLNAYQILDPFEYNRFKSYFSFDSLSTHHSPIGSGTYTLKNFTDTIVLANGDTVRNMLRMKLSDQIKNYLIRAPASVLDLHTNFATYFRGIYLAPDPNSNGSFIGLFRLDGGDEQFYSYAQLTYYYRKTGDTITSKFNMNINPGNTPFFNRINRDYTGTPAANYFNNTNADSLLIQGYPGFRSEVEIKLDNKIPNSIINKATLELTLLNVGMDGYFRNPEQLLVVGIDEEGKEYTLADRLSQSGSNSNLGMIQIGGTPFVTTINGNPYIKYHINIPREVQNAVIAGKEKIKIRIYSSTAMPSFYRMVAAGPNAGENERLIFKVIYSLK